jgi:hypothetical protein
MTMFDRTCGTCGKNFKSQRKDSDTCYGCALGHITGEHPPEEGDFNTALIASGEMSDATARQLQEDLESVDHSREEEFEHRLREDYYDEDDRWGYLEEDEECSDE